MTGKYVSDRNCNASTAMGRDRHFWHFTRIFSSQSKKIFFAQPSQQLGFLSVNSLNSMLN
jgi:hypothetical protein